MKSFKKLLIVFSALLVLALPVLPLSNAVVYNPDTSVTVNNYDLPPSDMTFNSGHIISYNALPPIDSL